MYTVFENSTNIFDSILMPVFFYYSLLLIILKLTNAIKSNFFKIDRQICNLISLLGILYIITVIGVCFAYHEGIMIALGIRPNSGEFALHLWFLILWRPLLLFMFTQLLRIENISNSMWFRGISAVLFLIIF